MDEVGQKFIAVKHHTAGQVGRDFEGGLPPEVIDRIGQFLQPALLAEMARPQIPFSQEKVVRQRLQGTARPEVAENIAKQMDLDQPLFTEPRPPIGGF
tara:strand:- start:1451 stop:1744 length:294 start_codon:yes stop_codon:yes gene_type:complete